jgi:hypothetical protein
MRYAVQAQADHTEIFMPAAQQKNVHKAGANNIMM